MATDRKQGQASSTHATSAGSLTSSLLQIEAAVAGGDVRGQAALQLIADVLVGAEAVSMVTIAASERGELVTCAAAGAGCEVGAPVREGLALYQQCIQSNRMVRGEDLRSDSRCGESELSRFGSCILVPLRARGACFGAVAAFGDEPHALGEDLMLELGVAATICGILVDDMQQESAPAEAVSPEAGADAHGYQECLPSGSSPLGGDCLAARPVTRTIQQQPSAGLWDRQPESSRESSPWRAAEPNWHVEIPSEEVEMPEHEVRRTGVARLLVVAAIILVCCGLVFGKMLLRPATPAKAKPAAKATAVRLSPTVQFVGSATAVRKQTGTTQISGGRLLQQPLPSSIDAAQGSAARSVQAVLSVSDRGAVCGVRITAGEQSDADAVRSALSHWRFEPFFMTGSGSGISVEVPVVIAFQPRSS